MKFSVENGGSFPLIFVEKKKVLQYEEYNLFQIRFSFSKKSYQTYHSLYLSSKCCLRQIQLKTIEILCRLILPNIFGKLRIVFVKQAGNSIKNWPNLISKENVIKMPTLMMT